MSSSFQSISCQNSWTSFCNIRCKKYITWILQFLTLNISSHPSVDYISIGSSQKLLCIAWSTRSSIKFQHKQTNNKRNQTWAMFSFCKEQNKAMLWYREETAGERGWIFVQISHSTRFIYLSVLQLILLQENGRSCTGILCHAQLYPVVDLSVAKFLQGSINQH